MNNERTINVDAEPYVYEFEPAHCALLIIDMQRAFRVRQMYAWIVILAVVGYLLNLLLLLAEQRMLFWYRTTQRT